MVTDTHREISVSVERFIVLRCRLLSLEQNFVVLFTEKNSINLKFEKLMSKVY